ETLSANGLGLGLGILVVLGGMFSLSSYTFLKKSFKLLFGFVSFTAPVIEDIIFKAKSTNGSILDLVSSFSATFRNLDIKPIASIIWLVPVSVPNNEVVNFKA